MSLILSESLFTCERLRGIQEHHLQCADERVRIPLGSLFFSSSLIKETWINMYVYAMQRVAAGAHLPTPWLFKPAKRLDDRADSCLDYVQIHFRQRKEKEKEKEGKLKQGINAMKRLAAGSHFPVQNITKWCFRDGCVVRVRGDQLLSCDCNDFECVDKCCKQIQ